MHGCIYCSKGIEIALMAVKCRTKARRRSCCLLEGEVPSDTCPLLSYLADDIICHLAMENLGEGKPCGGEIDPSF